MPPKEDFSKLLDIQSKAYNEATGLLFSSLTKRLDDQFQLITELKNLHENAKADIRELKTENDLLKSDLLECKKRMISYEEISLKVQSKLDSLEDYSRRSNLRIDGIEEDSRENNEILEVKLKKIFADKLGVENIPINAVHRLPKKQSNDTRHSSPRTVIAQLSNTKDKERTMRNTWKLKGSRIYVNDDVCENTIKTRKELIPQLKKAKADGKIAYFQYNKLIVRERKLQTASGGRSTRRSYTPSPRRNVSDLVNVFTPSASSISPPPSPLIDNNRQLRSQTQSTT